MLSQEYSEPWKLHTEYPLYVPVIIQSNFNGSNIFGTMEIRSRQITYTFRATEG